MLKKWKPNGAVSSVLIQFKCNIKKLSVQRSDTYVSIVAISSPANQFAGYARLLLCCRERNAFYTVHYVIRKKLILAQRTN